MANKAELGRKAFAASKNADAVAYFTEALEALPNAVQYYIERSSAHQRNKSGAAALLDAEYAVIGAESRSRELKIDAQLRRAKVLTYLKRYGDAKFILDIIPEPGNKSRPLQMDIASYQAKVDLEIKKLAPDDEKLKVTVKERPDLEFPPKKKVAEKSKPSPSKSTQSPTKLTASSTTAPSTASVPTTSSVIAQTPSSKIRHEYFQNADTITVSLLAKGVPKDAKAEFTDQSLDFSFTTKSGTEFVFILDPLYDFIDAKKSTCTITPQKVEFKLVKSIVGKKWPALEVTKAPKGKGKARDIEEEDDKDAVDHVMKSIALNEDDTHLPSMPVVGPPAYPTSSKKGPQNWEKVADEALEGMPEGVDDFFKKIYQGSDLKTRQAMIKSYTESAGTSLSTNHEEVFKGKVEPYKSDDMEEKKWEY